MRIPCPCNLGSHSVNDLAKTLTRNDPPRYGVARSTSGRLADGRAKHGLPEYH